MQKKSIVAVTAGAIAIVAVGASVALADKGRGHKPDFATLDADGNGEVTLAEIQAHGATRFAAADTDASQSLDRDELLARFNKEVSDRMERRVDRMIERFDANGDGALSADEFPDRSEKMAERLMKLDVDQSGGLSEEELAAAKKDRKGRWGKNKEQDDS